MRICCVLERQEGLLLPGSRLKNPQFSLSPAFAMHGLEVRVWTKEGRLNGQTFFGLDWTVKNTCLFSSLLLLAQGKQGQGACANIC